LHADVDLGTDKIKGGVVGMGGADKHHRQQKESTRHRLRHAAGSLIPGERRVTQDVILPDLQLLFVTRRASLVPILHHQ
jgi:hypothetical protein